MAARNILLADNGIIKIADFGLARQLYKDYDYKKQSKVLYTLNYLASFRAISSFNYLPFKILQGKLPVKWLAIESLIDFVFSEKSDVWAFGVVMWEIFSLGQMPYPGMPLDRLIERLRNGYRMAKPEYATNVIGQIMAECWNVDPNQRPTFSQLVMALSSQLDPLIITQLNQLGDG